MDTYDLIILLALIGFLILAFLLLAPVYFFLKREERASRQWTREQLAKRLQDQPPSSNGAPTKERTPES